jgi:hypothetical protein
LAEAQKRENARVIAGVFLCAFSLVACTTFQPLGAPLTRPGGETQYSLTAQVSVGDTLRLSLKNGNRVRVIVKAVTADAIDAIPSGEKTSVSYAAADIRAIERLDVNARRTAWIFGSIGAFLVLSAIVGREAYDDVTD